jgi:riboflavin kinase/FMN adenylyltransferase
MELVTGVDGMAGKAEPSAVTVGFFDGVHRGHQAVFARTVAAAADQGLRPVAVTFDRHPREVLTPGHAPPLITTLERKAELIAGLGLALLLVLPFDEEFSRWSPETFVRRVLVEGLRARRVVVGSNFTFGHKAQGTLSTLADLGAGAGFAAEGVPLLPVDGRAVSSSSIREAVATGELAWPREALGRRFVLDGRVTTGAGRGRGLGFPTANLDVPPRMLLPGRGVYAGRAFVPDGAYTAAVNVGSNPTFGPGAVHVEAFLLDFDGDLRGASIAVEFWDRLRDEERFSSSEALARQIAADVERTRGLVSSG